MNTHSISIIYTQTKVLLVCVMVRELLVNCITDSTTDNVCLTALFDPLWPLMTEIVNSTEISMESNTSPDKITSRPPG